ncbi:MAG: CPCC family cysteine-rich protein [Gammaproteobacteria bacterium]|nr:CPCC family cysteine-rich protein [Gammaproteobacteria bacterium]
MDLVPPSTPERFPCPCCGHLVFSMAPGSHQVCPVCAWEDDLAQLRFPRMPGSANGISLEDGQINYSSHGAAERRNRGTTRPPLEQEPREAAWRPLDARRDNIEEPRRGVRYGDSYPLADTTVLYYWRDTYWRRLSS